MRHESPDEYLGGPEIETGLEGGGGGGVQIVRTGEKSRGANQRMGTAGPSVLVGGKGQAVERDAIKLLCYVVCS